MTKASQLLQFEIRVLFLPTKNYHAEILIPTRQPGTRSQFNVAGDDIVKEETEGQLWYVDRPKITQGRKSK